MCTGHLCTHLRPFQHLPLVEDFHGVDPLGVLHPDNGDLEHEQARDKNVVNGTKASTFSRNYSAIFIA